ncbi:MAG: putative secreted Zn-dependent protease [Psychroserpens sp.]|jgi:predicted secreted Zn-dependent protease
MSDFKIYYRYLDEDGKRNITVKHIPTNIKITSPDYFESEMSNKELKSKVWEILQLAIKLFK